MAKSRIDITQCQHRNVGKFLSLYFFVLYYKTNIKHFFPYWYIVISTLVEIGKTRNCVQFLVFPMSTCVDITVQYINTENVLYLLIQSYWQLSLSSSQSVIIKCFKVASTMVSRKNVSRVGEKVKAYRWPCTVCKTNCATDAIFNNYKNTMKLCICLLSVFFSLLSVVVVN